MQKINTLFSTTGELSALANNVAAHQQLQRFWQTAAPAILAKNSFASSINNGDLLVYADSAVVANKIKLIHASLLTQLENLQKNNPIFRECKVNAINVKVQVKSRSKAVIKKPRVLSATAADCLKKLAHHLGESNLASKLNELAAKSNK